MSQEIDNVIDKYNEFLVALDSVKKNTSHPILYKLIAFDIIEMQSTDLQEHLLTAQEVLNTYGYEN
jgi:hypothetical protein